MVFIGTTLIVGFFFLIRGIQKKMNNLVVIAIGFVALPIGFIGNFLLNFGFLFQEFLVFFGFTLTVIFTNMTFHKNRKSYPNLILAFAVILGIIQIIFHAIATFTPFNFYYERVLLDVPYTLLIFNWLSGSSYSAYKLLKNQDIEPWIKVRYKKVAIFSFILSFHNIPEFFQPVGTLWGDYDNAISLIVFGITAILAVAFSLGFACAWIMPNWLKRQFNKDYHPPKDIELSEEDLINLIKKQLSNGTNK
ncbi:MAG: hypothetical protein ACFE85_16325 [Candidatus Hodarchaeota archaeon]